MKIMVFSDTHGNIRPALEMIARMQASEIDIDHIIHCGDYYRDGQAIEEETGIPVTAVRGNCDGQREREFKILETPAGKILITHGHAENVKFSLVNLYYLALDNGCATACYGHTHVADKRKEGDVLLLNPGSLTHPRGGSRPSCALLVADPGRPLTAGLLEY